MKSRLASLVPRRSAELALDLAVHQAAPLQKCPFLPVLIPARPNVDLNVWVREMSSSIQVKLRNQGAILFRGFSGHLMPSSLSTLAQAMEEDLLEYAYQSTPRTVIEGRVYSSTEYPANQTIPQHNEMSYSRSWPRHIWFACRTPATSGGQTPLADSRHIYKHIPTKIRQEFQKKGVLYVRNYGAGPDLTWQQVFGTSSSNVVDEFCSVNGIETEWLSGGRLRTRQVCQAVAKHPETGESVWFNQAHLFHSSALPPDVRRTLQTENQDFGLPRQCYFGDGSPIREEDLQVIREVIEAEITSFDWMQGDILLLDNMLVTHGRAPYTGMQRSVMVAMTGQVTSDWGQFL